MVDAAYRPAAEADEWLLHVRLGRDRAESTTEAYARSLALFLEWCAAAGLRLRSRPRHKLSEPARAVDAASDEEVLALLNSCRNARDRFIVLALWRIGNRRGELTGIRLEDVHFVPDATRLGCRVRGEHLHVRRRANPNGATAKSRRSRAVPADWFVVQAHDQYMLERGACPQARHCDFLLVNLFREPLGAPIRPKALNELLAGLSRRAGVSLPVWMPGSRCGTCKRPPRTPTREPRCGMTGPVAAWTGTPLILSPPTSRAPPGNSRGLALFRLAATAARRKLTAVIGHGP